MDKETKIVAALHISVGVISFCAAAALLVAAVYGRDILIPPGDPQTEPLVRMENDVIGWLLALMAVVSTAAGAGLWRGRKWARRVVLLLGALHLVNIPVGTALGGYTLWVLLKRRDTRLF